MERDTGTMELDRLLGIASHPGNIVAIVGNVCGGADDPVGPEAQAHERRTPMPGDEKSISDALEAANMLQGGVDHGYH